MCPPGRAFMRPWAGGPAGVAGPARRRPAKGADIMKKDEIKVGSTYLAKVGARSVEVRIEGETPKGGWNAKSVASGKPIRIKDPKHLRPAKEAGAADEANVEQPSPPDDTDLVPLTQLD